MRFQVYLLYTGKNTFDYWDTEKLVFTANTLVELKDKFGQGIYLAWRYNKVFCKRDKSCYEIRALTGSFRGYRKGIYNDGCDYYYFTPSHEAYNSDDLEQCIKEKNNIYTMNDLPLRSIYNITKFERKESNFDDGKHYYFCIAYNTETKEVVRFYSNSYLTCDIDKFLVRKVKRKHEVVNIMITKRKVTKYGRVITSICTCYSAPV